MECWDTAVKAAWRAETPILVIPLLQRSNFPAFSTPDIVLEHLPLQPFYRQLAGAQLGEVGQDHQLINTGLNDFFNH
ncbi:MAG TPA: hypothetical protein VGW77_20310 [Candidatus Binatia bacterium]|jgi:hypothetical protein|nr:hypothetical protein [Candidatus Binatia bacterium]